MHTSGREWAGVSELNDVLDFLRVLWAVEHRLKSASKQMQRRIGVTGPQRLVLRIVEQFPGITAGDLARAVQLHPSTLTGIIDRLRRKRLLACQRDTTDQRKLRLSLGSAARTRIHPGHEPTIEGAVQRTLRRLPARKVKQAREVLGALVADLEHDHGSTPSDRTRRAARRAR